MVLDSPLLSVPRVFLRKVRTFVFLSHTHHLNIFSMVSIIVGIELLGRILILPFYHAWMWTATSELNNSRTYDSMMEVSIPFAAVILTHICLPLVPAVSSLVSFSSQCLLQRGGLEDQGDLLQPHGSLDQFFWKVVDLFMF